MNNRITRTTAALVLCLIVAFSAVATIPILQPNTVNAANTITNIYDTTTADINSAGICTVRGKVNGPNISVIAVAVTESGKTKFMSKAITNLKTPDDLVYIDQANTGNTGEFLFTFTVYEEVSCEYLYIALGVTDPKIPGDNTWNNAIKIQVPNIDIDLNEISNQTVRIGSDLYSLDSIYYTREHILSSLKKGKNIMWYKVGNYWFDVLDKDCLSNEFLKYQNALNNDTLKTYKPGIYFGPGQQTVPTEIPDDYFDN